MSDARALAARSSAEGTAAPLSMMIVAEVTVADIATNEVGEIVVSVTAEPCRNDA